MKNFFKKLLSSKSQSKYFSETVQRVGKNNAGFSLVELIVVIAIMAILAAVAVIGVSVYIPKAQKAADEQSVSDIMDAFTLYYYSNPEGVTGGYVVLGPDGVVRADSYGEAVMKAVYGESNWNTAVKLQFGDWKGVAGMDSYAGTDFIGKEESLLNEVDRLTGALGTAIGSGNLDMLGSGFSSYMTSNGYDVGNPTMVGNAAVLYVAEQTKGKETLINDTISGEVQAGRGLGGAFEKLSTEIGSAAALSAIYAYAEGYAQFCDSKYPQGFEKDGNKVSAVTSFHEDADFSQITNPRDAFNKLDAAFGNLASLTSGADNTLVATYTAVDGQGEKNLLGYVDLMEEVNKNEGMVNNNLGASDCFTDGVILGALNDYSAMSSLQIGSTNDGEIAIAFVVKDGQPVFHTLPLDLNK